VKNQKILVLKQRRIPSRPRSKSKESRSVILNAVKNLITLALNKARNHKVVVPLRESRFIKPPNSIKHKIQSGGEKPCVAACLLKTASAAGAFAAALAAAAGNSAKGAGAEIN
jgi:hypothetical protein